MESGSCFLFLFFGAERTQLFLFTAQGPWFWGFLDLTSELTSGGTGNVHHVDGGLHSVAIPKQENFM